MGGCEHTCVTAVMTSVSQSVDLCLVFVLLKERVQYIVFNTKFYRPLSLSLTSGHGPR